MSAPLVTLGGSQAAAACGLGAPYASRVRLWAELTGRLEPRPESEAMRWGRQLEPLIRDELGRRGYELGSAPAEGYRHPAHEWMRGHPDALLDIPTGDVAEIKTAGLHQAAAWEDGAPAGPIVQCQHYLALTGGARALLACLLGGQRLLLRLVRRDEALIAALIGAEAELLDYVRRDEPPPPEGTKAAGEALRALYPGAHPNRTCTLAGADLDLLADYHAAARASEATARALERARQALELRLGECALAVSEAGLPLVRWTTVEQRRLDTGALRRAQPELWESYAHPTSYRRLQVLA